MFLRKLEKGECKEHGTRCRTARLIKCDKCQAEFVVHGEHMAPRTYCSEKCRKTGSLATYARAEENKKKWDRIRYGRRPAKKSNPMTPFHPFIAIGVLSWFLLPARCQKCGQKLRNLWSLDNPKIGCGC
jgi:hypothetical protein